MKNKYYFLFLFLLLSVCTLSSGCEDDDCSDLGELPPSALKANLVWEQFLEEMNKVENSGGCFVFLKEGGDFNGYRSSGLQVHGDFGAEGPDVMLNNTALINHKSGPITTVGDESRRIMTTSFSGEEHLVSLIDKASKEKILNNSPLYFPAPIDIEVKFSEAELKGRTFSMNKSIAWAPGGNSSEVLIAIVGGPGAAKGFPEILGSKETGTYKYNLISVSDNGKYSFSRDDFGGLDIGEIANIYVIRYNRELVQDETGATSMLAALSITGGPYILSK